MIDLLYILAALFLVLLNGFFVAAEFAIVKVRPTRIKSMARRFGLRGRMLARVHSHLDAYLSACQLGITLASLGLGWLGEPAFARLLEPVFVYFEVAPALQHAVSFAAAFSLISYLHIVVGELAPKSMALRRAEMVSLWTAAPLFAFYWLMYPFIWVLNHSSNWVLSRVGLDAEHVHESAYSAEEIKLILRSSEPPPGFSQDEWRNLANALDFGDLSVGMLMRPQGEMVVLYAHRPMEENLQIIRRNRYSRYPLVDEAEQAVIGVVHTKDLLLALQAGDEVEDLAEFARPIEHVRDDLSALVLLRRFRQGAPHIAVVDGNGRFGVAGFLTLDNLLSAMIGSIQDEYRRSHSEWVVNDDGTLSGKGGLPLYTLERALDIELEEADADTIGGLVMNQLDRVPHEGERVEFPLFSVVIKRMRGPRIQLLKVHPKRPSADE
ncbi:hemolysin family protein [Uliginosibacterium sp. sgz301328]|uniref:hemolysin family protein n=1 Tax=Uliginosibacterium sp. sgz301328 TaxID=3243764 RepID=UPI00359E51F3